VPIVGKTIAPHLTATRLETTGTFMLGHVRAAALFVANQRMSPNPSSAYGEFGLQQR